MLMVIYFCPSSKHDILYITEHWEYLTYVMPLHHHLAKITACTNTAFSRHYVGIKHVAVIFLLNITRSNKLDTTVIM